MRKSFCFIFLFIAFNSFAQTNYHVKTTGSDANDGLSWNTAFATVNKALSVATTKGDQIFVAKGTYYPDEGPGKTNDDRTSSFVLDGNHVTILGGFEGVQGVYTRNWVTNQTILSGEIQQDAQWSNNAYHVVVLKNLDFDWVFDGFIIKQGYANGGGTDETFGGGLMNNVSFISAPRIAIRNCTFSEDYADYGGGLFDHGLSIGEVNNCVFTKDSATVGAAIADLRYGMQIENCAFEDNTAGAGVIYNRASSPTIENCYFDNNHWDRVTQGGAAGSCFYNLAIGSIGVVEVCEPTIINCSITHNAGTAIIDIALSQGSLTLPKIINTSIYSGSSLAMDNNVHTNFNVRNSIVWGGVYNAPNLFNGVPAYDHCIVKDGFIGNTWNTNVGADSGYNLSSYPEFEDTANANLRIKCSSPAIDAGDNSENTTGLDLDNNLRIINDIIDIGAFEDPNGKDVTPPVAKAKNITIPLDANGSLTITGASVNNGSTDNCEIASLIVSPSVFDCTNIGANSVTLTVTDANGNSSTATSTVTITDNTPPAAHCKSLTIQLDATGHATLAATQVNDNSSDACGIKSLAIDKTSFDCGNVGDNVVTLTVTDNNNNQSTCSSTVTVQDVTAPNAKCKNVEVDLDANGAGSITTAMIDNGSSDACGIKSLALDKTTFNCSDVGQNQVLLMITDNNNNQNSCAAIVTVVDKIPPLISNVSVTPIYLTPPNHQMQTATVSYDVQDNCPTTCSLSVTSSEPVNGVADGDTDPDWIVVDCHHVQLRSERAANGDGRTYTITITVTDPSGNSAVSSAQVKVVHNVKKPVSGQAFVVGSTVNFLGEFWDKPGNKHTAQWIIDGSATVGGIVTEPSGMKNGTVTGSYKFNAPGVYKLQLNITDQKGITTYVNTNGDLEAIVVIYDPNGGYTYGGGYFLSPNGAIKNNPTAKGDVSYGYTVNYGKATNPKGETQFQFVAGNLDFNAVNFDYLAISGAKAQFKGNGKITGDQAGYVFIATVIDGALDGTGIDKIRMKIYNKNTGVIIYDNQPGASDADNPTETVGSNSVIVISGPGTNTGQKAIVNSEKIEPIVSSLDVRAMPNPSNDDFNVLTRSNDRRNKISMKVYDVSGKLVEIHENIAEGSITKVGKEFKQGVYFIRIIQGKEHKEIKLIKLSE